MLSSKIKDSYEWVKFLLFYSIEDVGAMVEGPGYGY